MSNLNFAYSSAPTRTIQEIQFGLFSAKESERLSVIDIEYPETMVRASSASCDWVSRSKVLTLHVAGRTAPCTT